jgi:beta-ribofuranosylaminobenzene 5'-phosphate synthase
MYQHKGKILSRVSDSSRLASVSIRVQAPARLHLGFLDLNGGLGRRFGSLGLALNQPAVDLVVSDDAALSSEGEEADRLLRYAEAAAVHLGVEPRGHLQLRHSIPAHAGLGSGTQIAFAVAAGLARLHGKPFEARAAAQALDRGNRSGIGLAAFLHGGLILDGGRGHDDSAPPMISRMAFPSAWRVVLIFDQSARGIHGEAEVNAFKQLPPFPIADAAHLCHLTLMRILPAAAIGDLQSFGEGITELQRRIGDHFAPAQGGRFASHGVAAVLAACEERGIAGVGQSSWGPTGFAIVASHAQARALVRDLEKTGLAPGIHLAIASGRNQGARVRTSMAEAAGGKGNALQ